MGGPVGLWLGGLGDGQRKFRQVVSAVAVQVLRYRGEPAFQNGYRVGGAADGPVAGGALFFEGAEVVVLKIDRRPFG